MRIRTLAAYLVGDRGAILSVAADRSAVAIGAIFVLSAGFAREYDGVDLRREPWRLILPFTASILMSTLLYLAIRFGLAPHIRREKQYPQSYLAFLGCFWMTAPLAWLYAVPYERFLSQRGAATANLATLGLVALWRVLLITRVSSILSGRRFISAIFLVMVIADPVLLFALHSAPVPILITMGGVQLTAREQVIRDWTFIGGVTAVLSLPVWVIGAIIAMVRSRTAARAAPADIPEAKTSLEYGIWVLAFLSIVVWIFAARGPQREQRLAADVDQLLLSGKLHDGVAAMSAHSRSEFPPVWEPPPRIGRGEMVPRELDVLEVIARDRAAPWVTEEYLNKVERGVLSTRFMDDSEETQRLEWRRLMIVLDQLPEGGDFRARNAENMKFIEGWIGSPSTTQPTTAP
jgi:hypothetical protein